MHLLMLLALTSEQDFTPTPTDKEAVVCRTYNYTTFTECLSVMEARKAQEYVKRRNRDKEGWTYAFYCMSVWSVLQHSIKPLKWSSQDELCPCRDDQYMQPEDKEKEKQKK